MKRRSLALCAGLLLLGLMPGWTLAAIPAPHNLDQSNVPPDSNHCILDSVAVAQTFTAGKTGVLSEVRMYLGSEIGTTASVGLYATSAGLPTSQLATASASVPSGLSWVHFSFASLPPITSGVVYAIVVSSSNDLEACGSSDVYLEGAAYYDDGGWQPASLSVADLGFMDFVDQVTATLSWDKPQVTAGATTPLTLTATMTFSNGAEAKQYDSSLLSWPTWFTPQSITCSGQDPVIPPFTIGPPQCTLANFESVFAYPPDYDGYLATMTFIVTGTADPILADVPTPGVASGEACLNYASSIGTVLPNQPEPSCATGTASVAVVEPAATPAPPTPTPTPATPAPPTPTAAATPTPSPTRAPTPPPTNTAVGPASGEPASTIWFLAASLVALFGGLFVLVTRGRRRII